MTHAHFRFKSPTETLGRGRWHRDIFIQVHPKNKRKQLKKKKKNELNKKKNLADKVFNEMVIGMTTELGRRMDDTGKNTKNYKRLLEVTI